MTQSADEGLLIQEANKQRQRQRAGKPMMLQVALVLVFLVIGCWLVFGLRLVPVLHYVALAVGIIAFAIAWFLVLGAVKLNPFARWGNAVPGSCPWCGRPELREHDTIHFAAKGSGQSAVRGAVTLCAADCGYAAVQDIKVRADGAWYSAAAENS
jgi:hypothetical protein